MVRKQDKRPQHRAIENRMTRRTKKNSTDLITGRGHILIGGTGRSGTTLLVQIFTHLNFDTGFSKDEALKRVDGVSRAGLERGLFDENLPYVIKSPWFADQIAEALERGLAIEAAIIPVRDLFEAAESRRHVYRQVESLGKNPLVHPGTIWKTTAPGEQEELLTQQFYKFLEPLVAHNVPLFFLSFPRFAREPEYFYEQLKPLFTQNAVEREEVIRVHGKLADPSLITEFPRSAGVLARQEVAIHLQQSPEQRQVTRPISGMDAYLSPVSFWVPDFIDSSAWLDHAPFAFWIISVLRPRTFVELGTYGGYSYFSFCQAVKAFGLPTRCYALDHWKGDEHGGFYGEEVFDRVRDYNERHYAAFSRLVRSTFDDALAHFPDASIDLLHIDGRHFYEDVRHDFESWRPKLSERAVVLFHDTNVRERDFGVFKLWEELQAEFPSFEFLHGHGLGVLGVGANLPEDIAAFFAATHDTNVATEVQQAYNRLGATLKADFEARQAQSQLTAKLRAQEARADELEARLAERDAEAKDLASKLQAEQAQAGELAATLETREAEAEDLAAKLQAQEARLRQSQAELDDLRRTLAMAQAEMAKLHQAFVTSTSWKLTAPVRAIKTGSAKIARGLRATSAAIRFGGGVLPTTRKAVRVLRREGMAGVKWRMEYAQIAESTPPPIDNDTVNSTTDFVNFIAPTRREVLFSPWHIALNSGKAKASQGYGRPVTITAVSYNSEIWLKNFFLTLEMQDFPTNLINFIIVDHGSTDGTLDFLDKYCRQSSDNYRSFKIISQPNKGFGGGHDAAIRESRDDFILVTNLDVEFHKEGLSLALGFAANDDADVACWEFRQCPHEHPKYYDPVTLETSWSSHACILIRRSAYVKVGGYETRIFMYGEDVELSYRLRGAGFRLRYVPSVTIRHHVDLHDHTIRPHQLSGSISANLLIRHRYGTSADINEANRLLGLISEGDPDPHRQTAFQAASAAVTRDREHFSNVWRPTHKVPFPFSGFDYDLRRDGHDVAFTPALRWMEYPLISIITRTHGPKVSYLREAMASVLNQTYCNIEHIIVEDRTNYAEELVSEAAKRYRRNIRYIKSDGAGRSRAGNCALAAARGDFCIFLDNDDLLFADHIELLWNYLSSNADAVAAYALAWEAVTDDRAEDGYREIVHKVHDAHKVPYDRKRFLTMNFIPIQCVLFKRALFERYGGFHEDLDYLEDWNLWVRYSRGGRFVSVPKVTSLYRTPHDEVVRAERQAKFDAAYTAVLERNRLE